MEIQPHNECFARQALSPLWLFPAVPGSLGMSIQIPSLFLDDVSKFPLNHVGIWTCIKPAKWIKLMHIWYLFQRTSTFIFQPDPVVEHFHIPSCFRILSTGREKTGAVRWLLKDVDNRDYWPGCVAEDVPLNWARGCRLIMNAVKEVMGWHDFTCPRECTARELDGGLQKNRKWWQQFADVLGYFQ